MKTIAKYILFACILASVSPVWGQSYSAIAEYTGRYNSAETIVRTWGDYALSYVLENDSGYLYLNKVDIMATSGIPNLIIPFGKKCPLPSRDFVINDIQILQDRAYFCGRYRLNAIYGYIDLPLTNSSQFNYYTLPDTSYLNKLVVYNNGTATKLVAIGKSITNYPSNSQKDIIIDVRAVGGTLAIHTMYTLPYTSNSKKESLYDLVLTDNYVVFIGHDTEARVPLFIRWADRSNISGSIQNRYDYALPTYEINADLLATVVDSTLWIAITYVHIESGSGLSTRVRLIDAFLTHNMSHSQEYSISEKMEPYDISYNRTHGVLTVLHNCTGSSSDNKFRLLDPFPTASYTFNSLYYPNVEFTSLYQFDNNHYIATGTNQSGTSRFWYMQDLNSPFPTTSSCPYVSTEQATLLSSPSKTYNPISPTVSAGILNRDYRSIYPTSIFPSTICNYPY